ncbi:predicted protein [Nematostella vectensis]|uniref:Uncharacterized protein n=1 Tax=Nematostella vectensis TaxID=45351 RepID=A7SVZ2_NEMVE|nr:predicted protein [Nematostella vectensis]|eukprot:XP_001624220.1 predicted protein [Nematostella vectensis]
MEWTDDHDNLLLREMAVSELFSYKKGSPDRGKVWVNIQETLNSIENPKFLLKDKRAVRDRWTLLQTKFNKRIRAEEMVSGIYCELSEKDRLIEELCEKEESQTANNNKKTEDKAAAEDVRKKAMQRMGGGKSDEASTLGGKKSRRSGGEVVEFLREKAKAEQESRTEQARQQSLQMELLRKQSEGQMQLTQALVLMLQKMSEK